MRTIPALCVVAIVAGSASVALAQTPPAPASPTPTTAESSTADESTSGELDFGARLNSTPTVGRFFRYDDLRSGAIADRLRYSRRKPAWTFDASADHLGYRDQRYETNFERYGKLKASFGLDQIPLWYGNVEQTPYVEESPGVFRLDDAIQSAIQNNTASIAAFAPALQSLDVRSQRTTTGGRFSYSATRHLDLSVALTSTKRGGEQPWAAPFAFSDTTVVPVPLDRRTNDVTAAAEWSASRGMARVAYDGSWFNNHIDTLTWDNPLRVTDQTNANAYSTGQGSSQGRMSLWPDSTAHTVSGSGSITLPARSRAFAYVSVGTWLQNDSLLPFTINSAIAPIPLPRTTAEAKAVITSMNYRFTSRPTPNTWFSGSYRLYDFDNRSEPLPLTNIVRLDGTVAPSPVPETEPFGYKRQFADVDVSYTRFRYVALRGGYGVEHDHRTFRYVERTTDQQVRASVDTNGLSWGSVRLQYDHSIRTGAGLDEEVLGDIGEQVSLRQFDIANRDRDRLSVIAQYLPVASVGLTATGSVGRERRPESQFGLQDNDVRALTFGADYTPRDAISANVAYSVEHYSSLQRSRQANPPPDPTFFDPRRDWSTDMGETVHTVSASLDLANVAPRTSLHVAYDDVHDAARYLYELAPNSTLPSVEQLPKIVNRFGLLTLEARHSLKRQLTIAAGYRLDHFDTNDFALGPATITSPLIPTYLNIGYQWRPYDVHTGFVRLIVAF